MKKPLLVFAAAAACSIITLSVSHGSVQALSVGDPHHIENISAKQCQLKKYLQKNGKGVFKSQADEVKAASNRFGINPAFMIGIAHQEGGLGKTIASSDMRNRNPGNVKTPRDILNQKNIKFKGYDESGHVKFRSWKDGWYGMAEVLRRDYIPYGRQTAYDVVTHGYAESNQAGWAKTVDETIDAISSINCKDPSTGPPY